MFKIFRGFACAAVISTPTLFSGNTPKTPPDNQALKYSASTYVAWTIPDQKSIFFGKINLADKESMRYTIQYEPETYQHDVKEDDVIQLPQELVIDAEKQIQSKDMTVVKALKSGGATILVTAGAPIWVKLASDVGTGGAAAVTSGLFNLGLGYTMGGVLFLTVAPATLGALTMRNISAALSEDPSTVDWSTIGGVAGGVLGTAGIVGLIATYGVGTATGAAITNGLAALGGGSIAAGGWGMLGGLVVAGGIDLGCIAAVGGLTYYFANWNRQSVIKEEFLNKIEEWHGVKKVIPPEIQKYISPKPKL